MPREGGIYAFAPLHLSKEMFNFGAACAPRGEHSTNHVLCEKASRHECKRVLLSCSSSDDFVFPLGAAVIMFYVSFMFYDFKSFCCDDIVAVAQ